MALSDLTSMLELLPDVLRGLPTLLNVMYIIGYVFFILFLGSISIRGYRGYMHFTLRFLLRIGLGAAALIAGMGLSEFLPIINSGIYRTFQLHVLAGGIISSVILMGCVYMISYNILNIQGIKNRISRLQEMLQRAGSIQGKQKLTPISIIGIVILVAFLLFTIINFKGFPNALEDLGLTEADLSSLADEIEAITGKNLPEGCITITELSREFGLGLLSEEFNDTEARSLMETNYGRSVSKTYRVTYRDKNIILGVTEDGGLCSVINNKFCECIRP